MYSGTYVFLICTSVLVFICTSVRICIVRNRMTPQYIRKICRELKLYTTPYLNDVLYLHYKGTVHSSCMCVCTYIHTYVCAYLCIFVLYVHTYIRTFMCIYVRTYVEQFVYVHTYVCTYVRTYSDSVLIYCV